MAVTPNIHDKNRSKEIKRMREIVKGPDGPERIKQEFGIDVNKGPLPGDDKAIIPEMTDTKDGSSKKDTNKTGPKASAK